MFWGPEEDIATALETIEERCLMAFDGIPEETRKSLPDGTTIFERVLPGADRMYPDTDSAPIPLEDDYIQKLSKNLPTDIIERYRKMKKWGIPEDTYTYIFSRNLFPLIERLVNELKLQPVFAGTFIGHTLKSAEGKTKSRCDDGQLFRLFAYLNKNKLHPRLAESMLPEMIAHPKMDFDSILTAIKFRRVDREEIVSRIQLLKEKFDTRNKSGNETDYKNWTMGQLRHIAIGNIDLSELSKMIYPFSHSII